jgi:hypothetical protein
MKQRYVSEEAGRSAWPPEIEVSAYKPTKDFGWASLGIVEARGRHGRVRQPTSDRVSLVLEGEGEFFFGDEEGADEVVPVAMDDVVLMPKDAVYDYQGRARPFLVRPPAYEQDSDVHLDDLWD